MIHPQIFHHGFLQQSELESFMKIKGVFIMPSHYDHWGVAVQEFSAAGFPLILSDKVGANCSFLRNGENGFIIPDEKIETYCFFIKEIMSKNFEFTNDVNYNANTMAVSMANGCKKALRL